MRKRTGDGVPLDWPADQAFDGLAPDNYKRAKVAAHLDDEELDAIVSRVNVALVEAQLDPEGGNVIVLRGDNWYYPEEMIEAARKVLGPKGLIIVLDGDTSIESLDLESMREAGWLSRTEVDEYLLGEPLPPPPSEQVTIERDLVVDALQALLRRECGFVGTSAGIMSSWAANVGSARRADRARRELRRLGEEPSGSTGDVDRILAAIPERGEG